MDSENFIESLIELVNEFDFANLMPELDGILGWVDLFVRLSVLAAPVSLLFFGLWWLILPPKEANHSAGYRCYFGMGSVEAWAFTQKLAGMVWTVLGVALLAVALLISNRFSDMEALDAVYKAISCILWEIALSALACAAINVTILLRYDRKGNLRSENRKAKDEEKGTA